jgi:hypothetical protein
MVRKHKEFKISIEEYLIKKGAKLFCEEAFRFKSFKLEKVEFILPYIQRQTYSVHILIEGSNEYNYHNTSMDLEIAIDKFKKHAEILWQ